MARQSRNELFKASFAEFINILEEAHEYNIHDWTCNCTTTNKRRIVHKYMFKIPVKRVLYEIDIPYLENGVWNQPGPVYESQVLPTKELFYSLFIDYYEMYWEASKYVGGEAGGSETKQEEGMFNIQCKDVKGKWRTLNLQTVIKCRFENKLYKIN